MSNYIEEFKEYLINIKKSSSNTVESYLRDINKYSSYCEASKDNIINANPDILTAYIDYLSLLGKSDATKIRIIASIRCFYRYLLSQNYINANPADNIKIKNNEKKLPDVLDANEIILLLSQPDGTEYKPIRDKAMLELLYATGIKVSELIELNVTDVNLQIGIVHLHNNKKERIIPIYPAAVKALANYIVNVRPIIITEKAEDKLFTNMNGTPMSRQGFWKIIKHYAETAGIKKDITPHTLRHSFAAHLLENGAQLKDIKEMLGHSDISSTQVYAKFIKSKYTSAYAKFHPLAK